MVKKSLLLTALFLVLCFIHIVPGSNVYSDKRGRPQYSSLIPFPRVGRSSAQQPRSGNMWYYGQKRGGKSGLIPFPRVGRSGANTWKLDEDLTSEHHVGSASYISHPVKRQSLIPFPRVGKRSPGAFALQSDGFKRRITRSLPRRGVFNRRILRSVIGDRYQRRITRSSSTPKGDSSLTISPHNLKKRQSLIPFPRTGKRSGDASNNKELDQFYVFENEDDEDDIDPSEIVEDDHAVVDFYDDSDNDDYEEEVDEDDDDDLIEAAYGQQHPWYYANNYGSYNDLI